ncbi:transposase, partial [Staphylococcus aureus]|uniref:transposase n=1 Tax=Staphylococcus aureus TaxID=1280 RepID=UPI003D301066
MAKYSYEFKLQVVQAYLDGEGGYRYLSKKYGVPSKRDIEKWVFAYYIAGHVFRIISCLNQVLFACNNAYCINEKKAIKLLETFEHKPEKYTERVNHIFEVLGISLFECYDMTEKLYKEVNEIVSEINNFL